jgi:hypothetical protein
LMGLGFASCASVQSDADHTISSDAERDPAGEHASHHVKTESVAEKLDCNPGEERNESGDCERPHEFDRPFHRGGR